MKRLLLDEENKIPSRFQIYDSKTDRLDEFHKMSLTFKNPPVDAKEITAILNWCLRPNIDKITEGKGVGEKRNYLHNNWWIW